LDRERAAKRSWIVSLWMLISRQPVLGRLHPVNSSAGSISPSFTSSGLTTSGESLELVAILRVRALFCETAVNQLLCVYCRSRLETYDADVHAV
jgi:hypothetical protein